MYCFDLFSFVKHLRDWPCIKSKLHKGHSLGWSPCLLPARSLLNNMAALAARPSLQLQPFSHVDWFWAMVSLTVNRYRRWLPGLINFRRRSWCFWAKRNQLTYKESCVYRSHRFRLPHSFPHGAVRLSLISIQTALLIASFEKMEQSGPFSLLVHHWQIRQGSTKRCETGISNVILSTSFNCVHATLNQWWDLKCKFAVFR